MGLSAYRSCRALSRRWFVAVATVCFLGLGCCVLWAGCATFEIKRGPKLDVRARWALLPVINHSETPQAGGTHAGVPVLSQTLPPAQPVSPAKHAHGKTHWPSLHDSPAGHCTP